jgi:hypothetical protein
MRGSPSNASVLTSEQHSGDEDNISMTDQVEIEDVLSAQTSTALFPTMRNSKLRLLVDPVQVRNGRLASSPNSLFPAGR